MRGLGLAGPVNLPGDCSLHHSRAKGRCAGAAAGARGGCPCSREDWEHVGCYGGSPPPPQALGHPCPTAQLPSALQGGCSLLNTFTGGFLNSRVSPVRLIPSLTLFYRWEG